MDLSIVIPCLNESETLEKCITKVKKEIKKLNIDAEIIVSDNGSTDGSQNIAKKLGAKVYISKIKGYGSAVINGIKNAKGKYVLIGDADDSYNFEDLPKFYNKIIEGFDIVQGCRMPSGGGKIKKGAMPVSHKFIGNPLFTKMMKIFYSMPFNDVYCGMKIIRNSFFKKANFFSKGMVFCLEILIKSKILNARVSEIPITLFKDGRVKGKSHLKTISDGIRTLKFILICCPKWIYFIPSFLIINISFFIFFFQKDFFNINFEQLLIIESILLIFSFQLFMLGLFASLRAKSIGLYKGLWLDKFFNFFNLRVAFLISFVFVVSPFIIFHFNDSLFDEKTGFIVAIFLIFFGFSLIANSLLVSLLSLDD